MKHAIDGPVWPLRSHCLTFKNRGRPEKGEVGGVVEG